MSREWDASKVPPSQFQRRKGSIYSTPSSRDGHVKGSERDQKYWDKLKEKVRHVGLSVVSINERVIDECRRAGFRGREVRIEAVVLHLPPFFLLLSLSIEWLFGNGSNEAVVFPFPHALSRCCLWK